MQISVSDAKGRLTDLVRRAEAGEEVILTRHGRVAVRPTPVKAPIDLEARLRLIKEVQAAAAGTATPRDIDSVF